MARGWESKSVEQQQELAASERQEGKRRLTPAQIEVEQRRQHVGRRLAARTGDVPDLLAVPGAAIPLRRAGRVVQRAVLVAAAPAAVSALEHPDPGLDVAEHRPVLVARFPEWADRVVYWNIHDVDVAPPSETLPIIERAVADLLEDLKTPSPSGPLRDR